MVNSSPPRKQKPAPFPETVVRSSLGGPSTAFPAQPSARPDAGRVRKPSLLPGDVVTELKMEVGAGARQRPRDLGQPLVGHGSSVLSRQFDSNGLATGANGLPSSPSGRLGQSTSILESRPNDLFPRPDLDSIAPEALVEDVIVKEAYKEDHSVVIKWDSETTNILGFRVIYRLFGTPQFKQGPPLAPSEREFRIKNVPDNVSKYEEVF